MPPDNMFNHFIRYYISLVQDGQIPSRAQIHPKDIQRILPWLSIGKYIKPRVMVPTLVGSAIDESIGTPLTGKNIFEILPSDAWAHYEYFYDTVCETPCFGRIRRSFLTPYGRYAQLCSLYAPLRSNTDGEMLLLGCSSVCSMGRGNDKRCMTAGLCPVLPAQPHTEGSDLSSRELRFGKLIDVSFADFEFGQQAGQPVAESHFTPDWTVKIPASG
ncbi:PAS domain-containing protein [Kordiimonas lacus]|uniref:PAS domain-containing protein n=2 Tax=Kordiimonas TaxID=288021 RepID=UPI002FDA2030